MIDDDFGFGPRTQQEIELHSSFKRVLDRYIEDCRITQTEPSSRGLALAILENAGEHVVVTAGGYALETALADVRAAAVSSRTGRNIYRIIVTRERKSQ